jgi:hypothetical protein
MELSAAAVGENCTREGMGKLSSIEYLEICIKWIYQKGISNPSIFFMLLLLLLLSNWENE